MSEEEPKPTPHGRTYTEHIVFLVSPEQKQKMNEFFGHYARSRKIRDIVWSFILRKEREQGTTPTMTPATQEQLDQLESRFFARLTEELSAIRTLQRDNLQAIESLKQEIQGGQP